MGAPRLADPTILARLRDLLGFPVEPGTLNLRLPKPWESPLTPSYLAAEEIDPDWEARTAQAGYLWNRVLIAGRYQGVVAQADEPDYPANLVELLSEVHLRQTLDLRDGDPISFTVVPTETV
jgi:CTP-dependent riboflavin kinase